MAKAKNKHIHSDNLEYLKNLLNEYRDYSNFDVSLDGHTLTVYAVPRNAKNRKERKRLSKSRHRTSTHKHNKE